MLELYDSAVGEVYGYLLPRCGDRAVAEDLTSEVFLAAVAAERHGEQVAVPWLIGVARHKLVDHWRRRSRDERIEWFVADEPEDPWDVHLDTLRARAVLAELPAHHRSALTLRYLDGLPVAEVAACLSRSLHATEALLVRARAAFRTAYDKGEGER